MEKSGGNKAKILRSALENRKKILLSATALQNSLFELYGLISLIDLHCFGDIKTFKNNYMSKQIYSNNLEELKERISKFCIRTLSRQVQNAGGINFTKRIPILQEFSPTDDEMELYNKASSYLQR